MTTCRPTTLPRIGGRANRVTVTEILVGVLSDNDVVLRAISAVRRIRPPRGVDGLLIPLRTRAVASGRRSGGVRADLEGASGNPLLDRLDPQDGRRLLALDCPLVWATSWMVEANEVIPPRLGLPDLPIVKWPDTDDQPAPGLHWKTMFLTAWAAGRPFVWLDDELADADRRWVAAHHPAPALLHRVDPYQGLTAADFAQVRRWMTPPPYVIIFTLVRREGTCRVAVAVLPVA